MPITDPSQLSPNPIIIDFENLGLTFTPNPLILGDVTFTSLTGTLSLFDISHWPANGTEVESTTLFPGGEPDSAISITFAHPVAEFLLGWGDPNFSGNILRAYDANGNLLEEAAVELGPIGGVHAAWIGFKRPNADIMMIIVQPDQSFSSGDDYVIDNIHYNTAVPDEVLEVPIDIKPGSDPNCFNNNTRGVIPIAILSSAEFDATHIDPSTVQLAGLGVKVAGKSNKYLAHTEDINSDGLIDLVVQIEDTDQVFTTGTTTATLTGNLYDGTPIKGEDDICIVP